jgi:KDO2-lipid IV(A) lauroyltransferase
MRKPGVFNKLLWFLETLLVLAPLLMIGLLPRHLSIKTGELIGRSLYFVLRDKRRIALKNIDIASRGGLRLSVSPETLVKEYFIGLGRSIAELSMLMLNRKAVFNNIVFEGTDNYKKAVAEGKGVIIITGHCGNWELMSIAASYKMGPSLIVARAQRNIYLEKILKRVREMCGITIIPKEGALRASLATLKKGGTVGFLIDQSVFESEAVVTDFFGEKVYALKTPAMLALKTGATVVPVFINYIGDGRHRIMFHPELTVQKTENKEDDIKANTKLFTENVEQYIKENPSEWLWIHRRFKLSHGRKY